MVYSKSEMKTLISKTFTAFRLIIVAFTIIAVIFGGANSAQRLFKAYSDTKSNEIDIAESAQLLPGPPEPDEKPGNMDDGKPNTEPSAYINSGLTVSTIKSKEKPYFDSNQFQLRTSSIPERKINSTFPVSFAMVSTKLAGQFTLVGSKPSGTS